ncbi:MAG: hypothetical protein B6U85_04455 [Desulfurococcales archaeon ex4484_42]|nr:MAG: hypothetical protein B6U85_04455 [Desulfurococcales archaeon ex4484_42]
MKRGFSRKYEDLRLRIDCVDVLVAIKEAFRYIELSSMLDLPVSTLSKYYHGLTIPDKETSKRILSKLLSREIVKDFIHRLIRNKKYGSLVKLLSNPLITNYLSLYFYMKIIDRLAGTNVTALIAPPDTSVLLALGIAFRLDVPLALIQSTATPIYESLELVREVGIDKGSSTIAIYSILGRECIPYLKKFIELLKLDLKFIGTIILVDRPILNELPKKVTVEYLLP